MSLPPELEQYRAYTKNFDISDEEKDELIMAVWVIMGEFVDLAFGVHPVQLAKKLKKQALDP